MLIIDEMQVGNLFYHGKMQTQMALSELCVLFLKLHKHTIGTHMFVVSVLYAISIYMYMSYTGTGLRSLPT